MIVDSVTEKTKQVGKQPFVMSQTDLLPDGDKKKPKVYQSFKYSRRLQTQS